jgi:hypothetical protein
MTRPPDRGTEFDDGRAGAPFDDTVFAWFTGAPRGARTGPTGTESLFDFTIGSPPAHDNPQPAVES